MSSFPSYGGDFRRLARLGRHQIRFEDDQPLEVNSDSALIHLGHDCVSEESVDWTITIKSNPHLMMVGLPGMGKTTCLINICEEMRASGIAPIVFSYHDDIDEKLEARHKDTIHYVDYAGLGFNPLDVLRDESLAHIDNVGMLRDIFSSIFPDLGEIQLGRLREALKRSYQDQGWGETEGQPDRLRPPEFQAFYDLLKSEPKPENGLLNRLGELDDYGFFKSPSGTRSLFDLTSTTVIRIHKTSNEVLQRAFSTFILHNLYQNMFLRGRPDRITHAIIFDEAHRAAKLKLLPTMAKECRKYGIALVVASQEVKDFDPSLCNAIANYLVLRVNESDAKAMAKIMATSEKVSAHVDRIKSLAKYYGFFHSAEGNPPIYLVLNDISEMSADPGTGLS